MVPRQVAGASACKSDPAALRELRGECEGRTNVGLFEMRKVLEQLFHRATGSHGLNHHANSHTHAADAGLSPHHFGIHRDPLDTLHVHIVAQKKPHAECRESERIPSTPWIHP